MTQQQVDLFLAVNGKYFAPQHIPYIREQLLLADESRAQAISMLDFKDPTMMLIISLLIGGLGIDRFFLGDITMGVLKLITGGGCGVWWLIDLFLIMGMTHKKNFETLDQFLSLR